MQEVQAQQSDAPGGPASTTSGSSTTSTTSSGGWNGGGRVARVLESTPEHYVFSHMLYL